MSAPKGFVDRPWLQRRVRLGNRVGLWMIRRGRKFTDSAHAALTSATEEYVAYRDACATTDAKRLSPECDGSSNCTAKVHVHGCFAPARSDVRDTE